MRKERIRNLFVGALLTMYLVVVLGVSLWLPPFDASKWIKPHAEEGLAQAFHKQEITGSSAQGGQASWIRKYAG